tara:strand:+ start:2020 stop:2763 length:744 start_codon:yes stop_codon:yes gene_type:complete
MKLILCEGDSWTAGDIIDPEIFGDRLDKVNDPRNRPYRLPKVWPHKLGNLLGVETDNNSVSGSSNDGIVRRLLKKIPDLLKTYESKDLFVIVGWSSPERKDFYYKGKWDAWETMYPAQLTQDFSYDKDLQEFYRIYLEKFWNEEEYMERYIQHNLLIHHFLNSYGINHIFFDAFYETKDMGIYGKLDSNNLEPIKNIKENHSISKTFRETLMKGEYLDEELFGKDYHPTEKGHETWARYLYDKINNI